MAIANQNSPCAGIAAIVSRIIGNWGSLVAGCRIALSAPLGSVIGMKGGYDMDYITIGPAPANEDCAQVGQEGYAEKAREECRRFIDLIRKTCGPEPPGARLCIMGFDHDFGHYYEVAVRFNEMDQEAVEYAFMVEEQAPIDWEQKGG